MTTLTNSQGLSVEKHYSKIMVIYPPIVLPASEKPSYTFPMGAGYIAAVLERELYEVSCLDAIIEGGYQDISDKLKMYGLSVEQVMKRIRKISPDIVAFSCQFSVQYNPTRDLITAIKEWNSGILTIIGGTHSSAQPEDVLRQTTVDYVVLGEGEETIVELLDKLNHSKSLLDIDGLAWRENKSIRVNEKKRFICELDKIPWPARNLFNVTGYFNTTRGWGKEQGYRRLSMITSRGCPYGCSFCGIHLNTGKKFRMRSAKNVLAEIEFLVSEYDVQEIMFEDDNISLNKKRFIEILQGIKDRFPGLRWSATSGMALWTLDEEILRLMKESGCLKVYLGLESGNERVLKDVISKHLTSLEEVRNGVDRIKRVGLPTVGFWVLGNPGETRKEMWDTLDFARTLQLDYNQVLIALPYKGTKLYDLCKTNNYFAYSEEFDPNTMLETQALIRTPDFTPEDVITIREAGRYIAIRDNGISFFSSVFELRVRQKHLFGRILLEILKKRINQYMFVYLFGGLKKCV